MHPKLASLEPEPTIDHVPASDTGSRAADDSAPDPQRTSVRAPSDTPVGSATVPSGPRGSGVVHPVPGYEILSELGRGGMGVVFQARHLKLNRIVALKMMHGNELPGRNELIRFLAEAEAVAAIKHENVVQVFDYGEADGRPFMALEFCEGGTLAKFLHRPLAADEAVRTVLRVSRGVAAAHALGIVHRDIKPGNIFLDGSGVPKVADFGLAKRGDGSSVTQTDQAMGTPAYMSPEQARGDSKFAGPQADVWSLGVILYEAIAGSRPFRGSVQEILAAVQNAEPPALRNAAVAAPRDLERICAKCMAKLPHERYPTAKELADDLERHLRGEPISVRPVGLAMRSWKWVKRNRMVSTAAAVTFLALTIGLGLAIGFGREAEERAQDAREAANREESEKLAAIAARNELKAANDRVNRTLATALLNPISATKEPPVKQNERMALLKLSELRRDPVVGHLVEASMRTEFATAQLAARSELVLHASIGLDSLQREAVERKLVDKIRDADLPIRVRANLVLAYSRWSGGSPAMTHQVADSLMKLIVEPEWKRSLDTPSTRHLYTAVLADFAIALSLLAPRLTPQLAREDCETVAILIGEAALSIDHKKVGSGPVLAFVPALDALSPWLGPARLEEAAVWMGKLAAEQRFFSDTMVPPLAEFCKRIPYARGAEICDPLAMGFVEDFGMAQDANENTRLSTAMRVLAPCLGPEASVACMGKLETAIIKWPGNSVSDFGPALRALTPQLSNQQADAAMRRVIQSLPKAKDVVLHTQWMEVIAALATRLTPIQAEAHCRVFVQLALESESSNQYQHALRACALRLEPDQALAAYESYVGGTSLGDHTVAMGLEVFGDRFDAAYCHEIVRKILASDKRVYLLGLANGVKSIATRMPADDAVRACEALAIRFAEHADRQGSLDSIAAAIAKLAPWIRTGRLSQPCRELAGRIVALMLKSTNGFDLNRRAQSLAAVAPFYEPGRGDPVSHTAALHLLACLAKAREAFDMNAMREILEGLVKLAPRLARSQEEELAISVTKQILDTLEKKERYRGTNSSFVVNSLAAFAIMLPLESGGKYRTMRCEDMLAANLDSLVGTPQVDFDLPNLSWITPHFAPLVTGVLNQEAERARRATAFAVCASAADHGGPASWTALHPEFHPRPRPLPPQQLVDLLKHPFCVGTARRTVLNALEMTYKRSFRDHWEFVEFVRANDIRDDGGKPLDLLSPPPFAETVPSP